MNKYCLRLLTFFLAYISIISYANSQTSFCDDFESYTSGSYLAASSSSWITWTGNPSEDVQVTNTFANSGTNSLFFSSNASPGGPQDVVLPFVNGAPYVNGDFLFTADFYVINGAYFNFQAETTPGITWALEVEMTTGGVINFTHYDFLI